MPGSFGNPLASLDHGASDAYVVFSCVLTDACMEYFTTPEVPAVVSQYSLNTFMKEKTNTRITDRNKHMCFCTFSMSKMVQISLFFSEIL